MRTLAWRLLPGQDLRRALEAVVAERGCRAAFVLSGIGSLAPACVRFAGAEQTRTLDGATEILTLSGTIAVNGPHLPVSLAQANGEGVGGAPRPRGARRPARRRARAPPARGGRPP